MADKGTLQMQLPELATPSRTTDEFAGSTVNYVEVPLSDDGLSKQSNVPCSAPSYCLEACPPACRVCLEDASSGDLVAPCSCNGSLQWAHPACIQSWINEKGNKVCEICRQPYKGAYRDPPSKAASAPLSSAASMRGVTLVPQGLLQLSMSQRSEDANEDTEHSGAQSSAAWCLSAVLLFLSLLLLRQAFEPLSRQKDGAATAPVVGSQNRHIAMGHATPVMPYQDRNMTAAVLLLPSGSAMGPTLSEKEEEEDSVSLFWITVKVLLFLLPFLMLLRVVMAMREIRLSRNANGHAADHSFAAILWNMEAGMRDDQFARTPYNLHPAAQHASTPLLNF